MPCFTLQVEILLSDVQNHRRTSLQRLQCSGVKNDVRLVSPDGQESFVATVMRGAQRRFGVLRSIRGGVGGTSEVGSMMKSKPFSIRYVCLQKSCGRSETTVSPMPSFARTLLG